MMAHNYYPDWNVVGAQLDKRVHEIDDMLRKGQ